jgi:putative membrane-bound dehydrogenase-like protein
MLLPLLAALLLQGSPEADAAAFRIAPGYEIRLLAAEPDVVDPVALAFDAEERLYVVEMPGYPNAGVAEGRPRESGRVRLLDRPLNGRYTRSRVFADGLNFPTSVMPWRRGVLVANPPDLLYLEDADGDGRAEIRRTLYSGFGLKNIQAQFNGLQWGLDNRVHALGAGNGGTISCPGRPDWPGVSLQGRNFRFHPDLPGSLEVETGGGQFGLAADDWGRWFTCTNAQHLRHLVLPDREMARNPHLQPPPAVLDIPDHGAAAKVFRISPFEDWRVERTRRRADSADARRFSSGELVPGGFVTSGTGVAFFDGFAMVCDPANNLVHRDLLRPEGASFVAVRVDEGREFLSSTSTWFRPCFLAGGPDGALYLCDFNREVIETPISLPEDIKARLDLESRGRGRIWRLSRIGPAPRRPPALAGATVDALAAALADPASWRRLTAQRLLVERNDPAAEEPLRALLKHPDPRARLHALCTLDGLGDRDEADALLADPHPGVREHAVRLASPSAPLPLQDPDPRVRFVAALALGDRPGDAALPGLADLARRDGADPYLRAAVLSSAAGRELALWRRCGEAPAAFLKELAKLLGTRRDPEEILALLGALPEEARRSEAIRGLAAGIRLARKGPLDLPAARDALDLLEADPATAELKPLLRTETPEARRAAAEAAVRTLGDAKAEPDVRARAVRLLGGEAFELAGAPLRAILDPREPESLQTAAVDALGSVEHPGVAAALLEAWRRLTPAVRAKATEVLLAKRDRMAALLAAAEAGDVPPAQIDPAARARLRAAPEADVARRAALLFPEQAFDPARVEAYRPALDRGGDPEKGRIHFRKLCIACHRAENQGVALGPDLASVRDNPPEQILTNILAPSLVVLPNYAAYVVETADGDVFNGVVVESSAAALTLRRPNLEDVRIARKDIRNLASSGLSIMPEGLIKELSPEEAADLVAYVRSLK